jgi:hypothetical protein
MQQRPCWEANPSAASLQITRILWNPKVYHRINKCAPPVSIPSQLIPVHTLTSHFLKIHLNIILPFTSGSPQWFLSLRFSHQNLLHTSPLPHTRYIPRPSNSSRFHHPHHSVLLTASLNKYKFTEHKMCVFIFCTTFVWNISPSEKNRARYDHKSILVFV